MAAPKTPSVALSFDPDDIQYPGGVNLPGYDWAFTLWVVLFLSVVCLGLLNYLGIYAKSFWPNL